MSFPAPRHAYRAHALSGWTPPHRPSLRSAYGRSCDRHHRATLEEGHREGWAKGSTSALSWQTCEGSLQESNGETDPPTTRAHGREGQEEASRTPSEDETEPTEEGADRNWCAPFAFLCAETFDVLFHQEEVRRHGRSERTRTFGLVVPNHALYQLSYAPTWEDDTQEMKIARRLFSGRPAQRG